MWQLSMHFFFIKKNSKIMYKVLCWFKKKKFAVMSYKFKLNSTKKSLYCIIYMDNIHLRNIPHVECKRAHRMSPLDCMSTSFHFSCVYFFMLLALYMGQLLLPFWRIDDKVGSNSRLAVGSWPLTVNTHPYYYLTP